MCFKLYIRKNYISDNLLVPNIVCCFDIFRQISPKLRPHTCLKHCFWCSSDFRILDRPSHISQILKMDKHNEFLRSKHLRSFNFNMYNFMYHVGGGLFFIFIIFSRYYKIN